MMVVLLDSLAVMLVAESVVLLVVYLVVVMASKMADYLVN